MRTHIPAPGALVLPAILLIFMFTVSCVLLQPNPMGGGRCDDGEDNDGDRLVDLDDPECGGDKNGYEEGVCANRVDDDGDGLTDLEDPACLENKHHTSEVEECRNGVDDDSDGRVDGADWGCHNLPSGLSEHDASSDCDDLEDNDGDGKIGPDDPQCTTGNREAVECDDLEDNDGDGLTDEGDPECWPGDERHRDTSEGPACSNDIDDDQDGVIDLADEDCGDDPSWDREDKGSCEDEVDDDGDGWTDGEDNGCYTAPTTECDETSEKYDPHAHEDAPRFVTECSDGQPNDTDDRDDAQDPECASACTPREEF